MEKREATPRRIARRKYEAEHKEERKAAHAVWGTSMNRADFEELNKFLLENGIPKIQLIYAGWAALKEQYTQHKSQKPFVWLGMWTSVMMGHVFRYRTYEHENIYKEDEAINDERT